MSLRRSFALAFALAAVLVAPRSLRAQDPDLIRGRITGPDSLPINKAQITITAISTNVVKTATTDKNGLFSVTFPNAEGDYWVNVSAIGFTARRFEVKRLSDEDVLVADTRLQKNVTQLDAVRTLGRRPAPPRGEGSDASGMERFLSMSSLDLLSQGDLAALAATMPGVTYIPGQDGGPAGFSVFGLDPSANTFMLNGMAVDGNGLPRDAGISTSINQSPYGSSASGGSGATVNSRLGGGGNFKQRTLSFQGYNPAMQFADQTTNSLGKPTFGSLGGRVAGPIIMNKMYYNVSFQVDHTGRPIRTMLNSDALALQAIGLAQDSVNHLKSAFGSVGLPFTVSGFPNDSRQQQVRLSGNLSYSPPSATGQSLSLTFNGNASRNGPNVQQSQAPSYGNDNRSLNGTVSLNHNKLIFTSFFSTSTLGVTASRSSADPYLELPSGSIRISSDLPDGRLVRNVAVGGNPSGTSSSSNQTLRASNRLQWTSMDSKHSRTLNTDINWRNSNSDQNGNLLGSFQFNSIADFEAGKAAQFTRQLTKQVQDFGQVSGGIGLTDSWTVNPDLRVQLSLRADMSRFVQRPANNPAIEAAFGVRNDHTPSPINFVPRIGFNKTLGQAAQVNIMEGQIRPPRWRVQGGVGGFADNPGDQLLRRTMNNTGLPSALRYLTCVGDVAPHVDWRALSDPDNIPTQCLDGTAGGSVFSSALPSVQLVDPNYRGGSRYSADVALTGPILKNRFSSRFSMTYARNYNQQSEIDLNFNPTVRFNLADEANRPVYVQNSSIVPATGFVAVRDARVNPNFNRVTSIRSDLAGESRQASVSITPVYATRPAFTWSATYSYQWNRRQMQGFSGGSTVGNPLDKEWTLNAFSAPHRINLNFGYNLLNTFNFQWTFVAQSGVPVTPRVSGDVNGDGQYNDRPFIFDPAKTADPALAAAMADLLANGSPIAKKCLNAQLGRLAGVASCRGPWTLGAQGIQVTMNPIKMRMPQRAQLQFSVQNPLSAVDLLFNGTQSTKGWGQNISPESMLLYVRGFDPSTNRYKYEVNSRFGSTKPRNSAQNQSPVVIVANLRMDIGPTRERQSLTQMLDRGRRNVDPKMPESSIKSSYISGGIQNPMVAMLREGDRLKLPIPVMDSLSYLNRWFTTHLDSIWTPAARYFADLPKDYDHGEAYGVYKRAREASFDLLIQIAPGILNMLTKQQKRDLGPLTGSWLDVKYLKAFRSSTAGGGASAQFSGPMGMEMMMMSGGMGMPVIIR